MRKTTDKRNIYYVYMHIFPNGKKYIGITSRKPTHRWGKNGNGYNTQFIMWNAIQKYGWDNIQHIIICANKNDIEAQNIEKYLIKKFNTQIPNGYNFDQGGGNIDKVRSRVKENHANVQSGNHHRAIKVYCIELNRVFECMRDAERELNIKTKDIGNCCKGKRNTAGGYHWIYANDLGKCDIDTILKRRKHAQITNKKKVRCIETNEVFDSITQASEKTKIDLSSIASCCRGKLKSTHGLHWEFVHEADKQAH